MRITSENSRQGMLSSVYKTDSPEWAIKVMRDYGNTTSHTYANRERMAYLVAHVADIGTCVSTPQVSEPYAWESQTAVMMQWFDGFESADESSIRPSVAWLNHVAALDYLIQNADRHGGNYGVTSDGVWHAIDHNLAFHPRAWQHTYAPKIDACISSHAQRLLLDAAQVNAWFRQYSIEQSVIARFWERVDYLMGATQRNAQRVTVQAHGCSMTGGCGIQH